MIYIDRAYIIEPKNDDAKYSIDTLEQMSFHDLRNTAKKLNLSAKGTRKDIIERILSGVMTTMPG